MAKPEVPANERDPLARLIRSAGRRPLIPPAREERVRGAVHQAWQQAVHRRRMRHWIIGAGSGLAAAVIAFAVITTQWRGRDNSPVATLEFTNGSVSVKAPGNSRPLNPGDTVSAGCTVETNEKSRAAFVLSGGQSLRLDNLTRMKIESPQAIVLETGGLYVDSDRDGKKAVHSLEVRTSYGTARDEGTQFEVRLADSSVRVRVREGKVNLKRGSDSATAGSGTELTASASEPVSTAKVSTTDASWDWADGCVLAAKTPAPARPAGIVSHIKVLSDKIEDVSSMEAWRNSFIKPGMTEEQKALAIWNSVVKFRHQDAPPSEFLTDGADVHDAIKTFNVYGYGMCCCASSNVESLGRYAGFNARGWGLNGHSVPELFWDGSWHLLDGSLIAHYPRADGKIAGVEDLIANITAWYAKNPGFQKNGDKLGSFMRNNGWKKGPEILANSKFYDINGWLPASTHGWYSTMQEFDETSGPEKAFVYEYGSSQGYEVNIELRHGERITRNWFNKGMHVNMDGAGGPPGCLDAKIGQADLHYAPNFGDLAPGRIGNGTIEYDVPLASGTFRDGALTADNLASAAEDHTAPAVHVKDPANPGVLIIRMPSSYVYLGGEVNFKANVGDGGEIALALSTNNGLDWTELTKVKASVEQRVDLKPFIFRRYDYRLRFTLKGGGTGLEALRIAEDIQHSQRALPALDKGRNTISFSAGLPEGSITIEGSTNPANKGKQLIYTDFHPAVVGLEDPLLHVIANAGSITFPVATPGDLTRLRFGCHFRARDEKDHDGWDMQVSLDNGKTFKTIDRAVGPTGHGSCKYVTFSEIPAGLHDALVRWNGVQRNTTLMQSFRIDADYTEPHGGFAKVKVTYLWDENGQPKQDVHIARDANESYSIDCAEKPVMKSIILELAE